MTAAIRFLLSELFPGLHPRKSGPLGSRHRTEGILTATAACLSRLYLPRASTTVAWPEFKGRIKAAGKGFWAFFALAWIGWLGLSTAVIHFRQDQIQKLAESALNSTAFDPFRTSESRYFIDSISFFPRVSPWMCLLISVLTFLTLAATRSWLDKFPFTPLAWAVKLPIDFVHFTVLVLNQLMLMASVVVIAFPGLLEGGQPTSLVPWWLWLTAYWGLKACKEVSQDNPRLREFTTGLTEPEAIYTFARGKVFKIACILFALPFAAFGYLIVEVPKAVYRRATGKPSRDELEETDYPHDWDDEIGEERRRRHDLLTKSKAFYDREGLNTLTRDFTNPIRQSFTEKQRDSLDEAYTQLVVEIGHLDRLTQLALTPATAAVG